MRLFVNLLLMETEVLGLYCIVIALGDKRWILFDVDESYTMSLFWW